MADLEGFTEDCIDGVFGDAALLPHGYVKAIHGPEQGPDEILFNDGSIEVRRETDRIIVRGLPIKECFIYA